MLLFSRLFGLALAATSAFVCVTALKFPSPYYVFGIGLIMGLCSLAMVAMTFRNQPKSDKNKKKPALGPEEINVAKTILLTFAYILLIQPLGFIFASVLFMVVLLWTLKYRKIVYLVVVPPPFVIVTYLFFTRVIHVSLPAGFIPL